MLDKEFLQAMKSIMDTALEPIKEDLSGLKTDVSELKADVSGLKADVSGLKADVSGLKADVSGLKADVSGLKADVSNMKEDISGLKTDVSGLKADVSKLQLDLAEVARRTRVLELTHENKVLPLLTDISSMTKTAYDRYMDTSDTYEAALTQVDVIGKVVAEHSEILKKIS